MDWQKTIRRVARKQGVEIRDLAKAIGITEMVWSRSNAITAPRIKIIAERMGISEEKLYLEALRDSKNLPYEVRVRINKIIDELRP